MNENMMYYGGQQMPYAGMPGVGYPNPMMGYYNPGVMPGNWNQNMYVPSGTPSLSDDEMKQLSNTRNKGNLSLELDQNSILKGMCNHRGKDGIERAAEIAGSNGEMYCPICGATWHADGYTREDAEKAVKYLIDIMQNDKLIGDLPINIIREFYSIIPLLEKYPEIHDVAMKNFERWTGQPGYRTSEDTSVYANYNALMGNGANYYYPPMPQNYYQQQMMNNPYGQPAQGQPVPPQATMYQQAATSVNPMQAPMGQYMDPYTAQQQMQSQTVPYTNPAYAQMQQNPYVTQQQMMNNPYGQPAQGQPVSPQQAQQNAANQNANPQAYTPSYGAPTRDNNQPATETKTEKVSL